MHKFQAHAATDVTGFGLLGHANNLALQQRNEVSFVIHNLPIIAKMAAISKACGNLFNLLQGTSAETSGVNAEVNTQYVVLSVYLCTNHIHDLQRNLNPYCINFGIRSLSSNTIINTIIIIFC